MELASIHKSSGPMLCLRNGHYSIFAQSMQGVGIGVMSPGASIYMSHRGAVTRRLLYGTDTWINNTELLAEGRELETG